MSASISPAVLVGMHLAVMLSIASIWNKIVPEPYMVNDTLEAHLASQTKQP